MKKELAKKVMSMMQLPNGKMSQLSLLEIMSMTSIISDSYEVYALQKENITYIVMITSDNAMDIKKIYW